MAFAAVISLKNIIERLLNSSKISLVSSKMMAAPGSLKIMEICYNKLDRLQDILKKLDSSSKRMSRNRVNALDAQIEEIVSKFEILVESDLSDQISSQFKQNNRSKIIIDLRRLAQDVESFIETTEKMEEEYANELDNLAPEEEDEAAAEFGGSRSKSKMVGLSDLVAAIRNQFTRPRISMSTALSLFGMAGIGKTTLAKEIFDDPLILSHFECRAWVKVGRVFKLNEIPRNILRQFVGSDVYREWDDDDDEKINQYLYEFLKDKRYLIVLDDVWETEVMEYLRFCFPESDVIQTQILITTRLMEIYDHMKTFFNSSTRSVRLLNDEESWDLFREKVFGEEWCPPKLEEAGKKIVKICDGLPLTIIKVSELLLQADITVEYWNEVAADKEHAVFGDVYGEISKILFPSYEYLPQHLKPCFMYMGIFPQDYEFSRSELIDMWMAEGFLVPDIGKTLEECATEYLVELESNSLVIVCEKSTIFSHTIKTCRLHASLWHFCRLEVRKNKFFTILNSLADGSSVQDLKGQRRLSIHNNILLGIKDVFGKIEDGCAITAHSLLCLGAYHHFPLPLFPGLRFLRVLRARSIRLYEFPMEVLELVHLRYLALTFSGKLPASVSKLFNLQFLIIHRHLSVNSSPSESYVPVEIWDMQELIHLQIMGGDLPKPTAFSFLKNLRTLLDVSFDSCTRRVLQRISYLKNLGIQIELEPDDEIEFEPFRCFTHISHLQELESLKCVVVNPELKPEVAVVSSSGPLCLDHISHFHKLESSTCIVVNPEIMPEVFAPPAPLYNLRKVESHEYVVVTPELIPDVVASPAPPSIFPSSLLKLHLSGLCCPWGYMDAISSLPNLEVLKLRCYAFQGPMWEVEENKFPKLKFLVIDDADLVEWKVGVGSFSRLRNLSIKHCYNLQEFDWDFDYYFKKVEIVDSNPLAEAFFDRIKDRRGRRFLDVSSRSSWDDEKLKSRSS